MIRISRSTSIRPPSGAVVQKTSSQKVKIDWPELRRQAELGQIPEPPIVSYMKRSQEQMIRDVAQAARARKIAMVRDINVPTYNAGMRIVSQYRDLCLVALDVVLG